ncbi:hypothetical protein BS50DRAFT_677394 [Corynespora cassiicola Philippines]|uniref:SGF29 C-terminal domain-containing protein n=1 Tax=Corynespora cassiicola Philippines TaxID=1448308 RepID=A0A2T2NL12_CORCC|nr:hypothetical protein BS50DRAFT_677394 [Corynespora cassiicola Philippines]
MAARSRPRAGQLKEEVDEERSLWNQIRAEARRIDQLMAQSDRAQERILELQQDQTARIARGDDASERINAELEEQLRNNIRLTEEIMTLVKGENGDDICAHLELLKALRESSDNVTPNSRATSVGKSQRDRQNKRKATDAADDRDSIAADSPADSPAAKPRQLVGVVPGKDRLMGKSGGSRAGSVPAVREGSVKVEDDRDEHVKEPKQRLTVNTEVLYRNNKSRNSEGEGILCRVTSVIGEGKQRRYEIIDSDPDPPSPAIPYRASVNHLVAIPPPSTNMTLPDLPPRRNVLALYPGTTTFYKAEVVSSWSGGAKVKKEGDDGVLDHVSLRFEGEDEVDRVMNVERRYVLPDK